METTKKRGRKTLSETERLKVVSLCLPPIMIIRLKELASERCVTLSILIRDMISYSTSYNPTFNNFKE